MRRLLLAATIVAGAVLLVIVPLASAVPPGVDDHVRALGHHCRLDAASFTFSSPGATGSPARSPARRRRAQPVTRLVHLTGARRRRLHLLRHAPRNATAAPNTSVDSFAVDGRHDTARSPASASGLRRRPARPSRSPSPPPAPPSYACCLDGAAFVGVTSPRQLLTGLADGRSHLLRHRLRRRRERPTPPPRPPAAPSTHTAGHQHHDHDPRHDQRRDPSFTFSSTGAHRATPAPSTAPRRSPPAPAPGSTSPASPTGATRSPSPPPTEAATTDRRHPRLRRRHVAPHRRRSASRPDPGTINDRDPSFAFSLPRRRRLHLLHRRPHVRRRHRVPRQSSPHSPTALYTFSVTASDGGGTSDRHPRDRT